MGGVPAPPGQSSREFSSFSRRVQTGCKIPAELASQVVETKKGQLALRPLTTSEISGLPDSLDWLIFFDRTKHMRQQLTEDQYSRILK